MMRYLDGWIDTAFDPTPSIVPTEYIPVATMSVVRDIKSSVPRSVRTYLVASPS